MRWTTTDIPSQAGRLAVVTGATGGLGFEVAAALAAAEAQVVIASRDAAKGAAALQRLQGRAPPGAVRFERLDLADLASVRAFADGLLEDGRPLDLLVNNAGVMGAPKRRLTVDGFEEMFGVNHLGAFALTGRLLPLLRRSERGARMVGVSSLAHAAGRPDFADLQSAKYSGMRAYGRSKAALLMFVRAFQRRSEAAGWGVEAVAAHPGWAATDLLRPQPGLAGVIVKAVEAVAPVFSQSAAQGALPILYAATAAVAEPGGYYGPDGALEVRGGPAPARAAAFTADVAEQDRLWAESERLTGVAFG